MFLSFSFFILLIILVIVLLFFIVYLTFVPISNKKKMAYPEEIDTPTLQENLEQKPEQEIEGTVVFAESDKTKELTTLPVESSETSTTEPKDKTTIELDEEVNDEYGLPPFLKKYREKLRNKQDVDNDSKQ